MANSLQQVPQYFKGLRRHPNKDYMIALSAYRHQALMAMPVDPRASLPAYDARNDGLIPPIKDQQQCGSCWDFSGTCVVEVALIKAGLFKNDGSDALSEEYTLSCGQNGGCNGDDNVTVLEWAKKTGIPKSSDYGPYTARRGSCAWKSGMPLYMIDDWGFADGAQGNGVTPTDAIKDAIVKYGAVGIAIAADDAFSNISGDTVFDRTTSTQIDHDVILVGWDDIKGSKGAWILRNSWGTSWAMAGYCWIGYGINMVGSEAVWAYKSPITPVNPFII